MEPSGLSVERGARPRAARGWLPALRAGEWWDYKIGLILTLFYGTTVMLGRPLLPAWPELLALLVAMVACAAFASLVNDAADLAEDRAAGKPNRLAGGSPAMRVAAVLAPAPIGVFFLWLWRDDAALAAAYGGAWAAFALYSLPPLRLKARGLAGVLADAAGAHVFPTLVAMLLAFRAAGVAPDPAWIAAGAAWGLGYGMRGILSHQLGDRDRDQAAGVRTFAQRHPRTTAVRTGALVAFPLEAAGLGLLLWRIGTALPLLALALYLVMAILRVGLWRMNAVVVEPKPRFFILLHEYYDALLPAAVLIAAAMRHPADALLLVLHLLLFRRRPIQVAVTARSLAASLVRRLVQSR